MTNLLRGERRVKGFLDGHVLAALAPTLKYYATGEVEDWNLAFFRRHVTFFEPEGILLNLGKRHPRALKHRPSAAWKRRDDYFAQYLGVDDIDLNRQLADALDVRCPHRLPRIPDKMLWNNPSRTYTRQELKDWATEEVIKRLPGRSRMALRQALRRKLRAADRSRVEWRVICDLVDLGLSHADIVDLMMRAAIKPRRKDAMERQVWRAINQGAGL